MVDGIEIATGSWVGSMPSHDRLRPGIRSGGAFPTPLSRFTTVRWFLRAMSQAEAEALKS